MNLNSPRMYHIPITAFTVTIIIIQQAAKSISKDSSRNRMKKFSLFLISLSTSLSHALFKV